MSSSDRPSARPHILIVEDNPNDEALELRALQASGLEGPVAVLRDGAEAVTTLTAPGARLPGVVILDLQMPKLGGLEVLARLRAHDPTRLLPVVVFTSSDDDQDKLRSYQNGANSYVRKPVGYEEFCAAIRQVVEYWTRLNLPAA